MGTFPLRCALIRREVRPSDDFPAQPPRRCRGFVPTRRPRHHSGGAGASRPPREPGASGGGSIGGDANGAVFRDGEPSPSVTPTVLRVELISGAPKEGNATVLTDEDCTPDDAGISHCRNSLRLENGSEIVVRHPHDMMKIPCVEPGEPVLLVAA